MTEQRTLADEIFRWMAYGIILGSIIVAAGRFTIPSRPVFTWWGTYEALAHIWVGMLIAWCMYGPTRKPAAIALGVITALDVVMSQIK